MTIIQRLAQNRRAATSIEYALLAGLIAVVIIGALTIFGTEIGNTFNAVANAIQ